MITTRESKNDSENLAAITFQRRYRGHLDRKNYAISPIKQFFTDPVFFNGNDPTITGLESYQVPVNAGPLVLVGNSCIRSVEIACELAVKNHKAHLPKLILVDASQYTKNFWRQLKKFFSTHKTESEFLFHFKKFIEDTEADHTSDFSFRLDRGSFEKECRDYIMNLFLKFGYDDVRDVTLNTAYVAQNWVDTQTFVKLDKIIKRQQFENVFVYASNIVATNKFSARDILKNIQLLNPKLSIHSNLVDGYPTQNFLIQDQTPAEIEKLIFKDVNLDKTRYMFREGYRMYAATTAEFSRMKYNAMLTMVDKLVKNKSDIQIEQCTFLPTLIFKLVAMDVDLDIRNIFWCPSLLFPRVIFRFDLSPQFMQQAVQRLNAIYPLLQARDYILPIETQERTDLQTVMSFSTEGLAKTLEAVLANFLDEHPELIAKYQADNQKQKIFYEFVDQLNSIFKTREFVTSSTDGFEEGLCYLAKARALKLGVSQHAIENIMTTSSEFMPSDKNNSEIYVFLSTPIPQAKYISDYLNEIKKDSCQLEEKEAYNPDFKKYMTRLTINYQVLQSKTFLGNLTSLINHHPQSLLEKYWKNCKSIKNTSAELSDQLHQLKTELADCKEVSEVKQLTKVLTDIEKLASLLKTKELPTNEICQARINVRQGFSTLSQLSAPATLLSMKFNSKVSKDKLSELRSTLDTILNDSAKLDMKFNQLSTTSSLNRPRFG